jgi:hypothetical protein
MVEREHISILTEGQHAVKVLNIIQHIYRERERERERENAPMPN